MNGRDIAGAIPFVGTFVAIGTLIKESFQRNKLSATDLKIQSLFNDEDEEGLKNLLLSNTPDLAIKKKISDSQDDKERLFIYYEAKMNTREANLRNAAWELIPVVGLIHHLIFNKSLDQPSLERKVAAKADGLFKALTLMGLKSEGEEIYQFYQSIKAKPAAENMEALDGKITSIFNPKVNQVEVKPPEHVRGKIDPRLKEELKARIAQAKNPFLKEVLALDPAKVEKLIELQDLLQRCEDNEELRNQTDIDKLQDTIREALKT